MYEICTQIVTVCALGAWLMGSAAAQELTIENDQFVYGGQLIPAGCIAQLSPQLNGDQLIASVFLQRPSYRGCMWRPIFPTHNKKPEPSRQPMRLCTNGRILFIGSMPVPIPPRAHSERAAPSCRSNLSVGIITPKMAARKVFSVSGTGEWSEQIWATPGKHFDTEQRVLDIRKHYQAVAGNQRLKTTDYQRQCAMRD